MAHTYTDLLTHIVFSTKDRQPLIVAELKPRLHAYLCGIVERSHGKAFIIGGTSDHVHLLVGLPPQPSLSDALRIVKANSSKWVHEQNTAYEKFAWQSGYGAFSVSHSNADAVYKYIANQEEHHRRITFQEEYLMFLRRHGIEYDERYIWT